MVEESVDGSDADGIPDRAVGNLKDKLTRAVICLGLIYGFALSVEGVYTLQGLVERGGRVTSEKGERFATGEVVYVAHELGRPAAAVFAAVGGFVWLRTRRIGTRLFAGGFAAVTAIAVAANAYWMVDAISRDQASVAWSIHFLFRVVVPNQIVPPTLFVVLSWILRPNTSSDRIGS